MKMFKKIVAAVLVLVLVLGISTCAMASGVKTFRTTANVNMRNAAGTTGTKITTIPKGTEFNATDCVDVKGTTWYYGSYGTKVGWVCGTYLMNCRKITTGNVNMRFEPDLDGARIIVIPEGEEFFATDCVEDGRGVMWYYGTYAKKTGWVSEKYLADC